jgi:hypothetical protein
MAVGVKQAPVPAQIPTPQASIFAAARLEYQALFSSMAVGAKQTPTPAPLAESVPAPTIHTTSESVQEIQVPTPMVSAPFSQTPRFTAASQEYRDIFTSMAVRARKVPIAPPAPDCPQPAERPAESTLEPSPQLEIQVESREESAITTPKAGSLPPKPKFAAASQDCHGLSTSIAVGVQETSAKETPVLSPSPTTEIRTESDPAPSSTVEKIVEYVEENPTPTPKAVPPPPKPKFAAASQEYYDLFTSMAVGPNKTPVTPAVPAYVPPALRIAQPVEGTSKTTKKTILQHQRSKSAAIALEYHDLSTTHVVRAKNVQHVAVHLPAAEQMPEPVFVESPEVGKVEEFVTENLVPITKTVSPTQNPRFAVASLELHDLFTSMAVRAKPVQQKFPATPRQSISQPHTSPSTSSSSPPAATTSPCTPEETGSSSAGSSPPRPRPQTTDLVARRLIGAALGIKVSTKKDEKTSVIQKALRMKGKGEGLAAWEDYAACAEN